MIKGRLNTDASLQLFLGLMVHRAGVERTTYTLWQSEDGEVAACSADEVPPFEVAQGIAVAHWIEDHGPEKRHKVQVSFRNDT